jgi:23S rRNA (pseudouridine1915-N3)-methyltransferase
VKLHILAVGHRMPGWVRAGFEDYARRMPRELPLLLKEVRPEPRGSGTPSTAQIERILKAESTRLRGAAPHGSLLVLLDERGRTLTSEGLAQQLQDWQRQGRDVCFAIGGADGLDADLWRSAHLMLSVSAMTLPHQLVRVVLAEQLYRAACLLQHHPYHRR